MESDNFNRLLEFLDENFWGRKVGDTNYEYNGLTLDYYFEESVFNDEFINIDHYFNKNGNFTYNDRQHLKDQYENTNEEHNLLLIENIINIILTSNYNKEHASYIISKVTKYLDKCNIIISHSSNGTIHLASKNQYLVTNENIKSCLSTEFLEDQIDKCKEKIYKKDFDGAITNARSMVEEVLLEIEKEKTGLRGENNGNITSLYKRVQKLINLSPDMPGITTSMQQIMTGLISIINGLGSLRSKISDSHAPEYKANEHHAFLCVNCSMTLVNFLIASYEYQKSR